MGHQRARDRLRSLEHGLADRRLCTVREGRHQLMEGGQGFEVCVVGEVLLAGCQECRREEAVGRPARLGRTLPDHDVENRDCVVGASRRDQQSRLPSLIDG